MSSFWSRWKEKRKSKKLEKYARKICHINTTHETRETIITELMGMQGEEPLKSLIKRYDLTLHEKPTKDESEKEMIASHIVSKGQVAIEVVKDFIRNSQNISWPFDILKELVSEDDFIDFTLSQLTTEEVLFDEQVIDRRLDVLNILVQYNNPKISDKVSKLIEDNDDRVKILALNIIANQKNIDDVRERLLKMMVDEETPPRVVRGLIDIFVKKEWKLTGFKNKVDELLPHDEYFINKDGIIRSRQVQR